jgi:hypothetical protein
MEISWKTAPMIFMILTSLLFHNNRKTFAKLVRGLNYLLKTFGRAKDGQFYVRKLLGMAGIYIILMCSVFIEMYSMPSRTSVVINVELLFLGFSFTVFFCSFCIIINILKRSYIILNEKVQAEIGFSKSKICCDFLRSFHSHNLHLLDVDSKENIPLFDLEKYIVSIQDILEQLQTCYSYPLLVGNLILVANVILGFFIVLDSGIKNKVPTYAWSFSGISMWSLAMLLWVHTVADEVNSAVSAN